MHLRIALPLLAALSLLPALAHADGPTCSLECGDAQQATISGDGWVYSWCYTPAGLGESCDPWTLGDISCEAGLWCSACSGECESGEPDCGCEVILSPSCEP